MHVQGQNPSPPQEKKELKQQVEESRTGSETTLVSYSKVNL